MTDAKTTETIRTFCAHCISRCGAKAETEDGRLASLSHDPDHPTGKAFFIKGKAATELVDHPNRLTHPMKRTLPKGDPDPGWEQITWDEALDTTADRLKTLAADHGPETVIFN